MNASRALLIVLGFSTAVFADEAPKKAKPKFTISKETTFITEPLDKDGYPDYAAALNAMLGKGVTPENNANVLIWKALGPRPEGKPMPPEFFKLMGMDEPSEKGEYFVDLARFLRDNPKIDPNEWSAIFDHMRDLAHRTWKTQESPHIVSWLKANEKPLAQIVQATKRSHYYNPLVPTNSEKGTSGLFGALLPSVQKCRYAATAFACRAMLHLGEGRSDEAWQDLLACHRLARHVGRGGTLIEALVGIAIDAVASKADLVFLEHAKFDARQMTKCVSDLHALQSLPDLVVKVDLCERFNLLEVVTLVNRHGIEFLERMSDGAPRKKSDPFVSSLLEDTNWDPALKNVNRWYNRLATVLREPDRATRDKKLEQFENSIKQMKRDFKGAEELAKAILDGKAVPETKGRLVGDILIVLMLPATHKVQGAADRAEQTQRNLHIAFALAAYQREHGKYPEKLDALAPKYLAKVPNDYFTGKPLVYRPTEKGYLLYSFGPNGKDDEGKGREDDVRCDDISVRMPIPQPKRQ